MFEASILFLMSMTSVSGKFHPPEILMVTDGTKDLLRNAKPHLKKAKIAKI